VSVERYQFIASGQGDVVSAFKSIGRAANDSKTIVERSFEGVPRAAARSAVRTEAVESRAQARRIAILERADQQRKARLERSAQAELRALERRLAKEQAGEERAAAKRVALAEKTAKAEADARSRRVSGAVRGLGSMAIRGATLLAAGAVGMTGLAMRESLQLDERARRVAIQGSTLTHREDPTGLRRHFENTALAVPGASAAGVAGGAERFMAKTGDIDAAKRFSQTWAEVAVATSASIEDIADASADLMTKFDIKKTEDMAAALSTLAVQGKRGAFELKDAAVEYPRIAAAAQRFGIGKGVGALTTLGGLTQLARSATGSSAEAGTSVERMFSNMGVKAGKIRALTGVDVWKGDFKENLVNIIGKAGGSDYGKKYKVLSEVFGERGIRAISPLMSAFAEAVKDGKDGFQAMRDKLAEATDATGADAEIQRDLATAQEGASARLTAAWESIKAQLGEATPEIADLAKRFADFISTTDFGFLATALDNLADAAGSAADFLESLGVLKKKPKTVEDQVRDAERQYMRYAPEREKLQKRLNEVGPGGLSKEEFDRLGELNRLKREPGRLRMEEERRKRDLKEMASGYMSQGELADALTGADTGQTLFGHKTQLTREGAKSVAEKLAENPDIPLRDLGLDLGEDSPALAKIRKFAGTVHTARGEGSGITADERARAADTLNRGSAAADETAAKQHEFAAKQHQQAAQQLKDAAEALKRSIPRSHFAGADAQG
jgi:hypothetical protein